MLHRLKAEALGNDSSRDGGSSRCRSLLKRAKGEGVAPRPRGPLAGTLPPRSETRHHCYGSDFRRPLKCCNFNTLYFWLS
jgi:hypothetical protein